MQTVYQKEFTESLVYFEQIFLMEMENKGQVYIFYTMSTNLVHRIGMFEALIDETKTDDEQLIIDWGELNVPSNSDDDDPDANSGPISLGGGYTYLLTTFEKFSYIKGYTICPYDQVIKDIGSTACVNLPESTWERFTLNPFDDSVTECATSETLS